jgi:hypothetical protein
MARKKALVQKIKTGSPIDLAFDRFFVWPFVLLPVRLLQGKVIVYFNDPPWQLRVSFAPIKLLAYSGGYGSQPTIHRRFWARLDLREWNKYPKAEKSNLAARASS